MHIRHPTIRPPKIHWRRYIERKVVILGSLAIATFIMESYFHVPRVGGVIHGFHDLTVGVLAEHLVFGIPMEE